MIRCPFCDHKNPPGATRCAECKADLSVSSENEDEVGGTEAPSLNNRVIALVRDGRKIEAIKLYRDLTGAGLKEAKDAVEALERGDPPASTSGRATEDDADILDLLRAGQKIRAIKLYRDKTGAGLVDAKNAVETLARKSGIPVSQSGCGSAVLLVLVTASLLAYVASFVA
jgi:ribosomal protein L7/L12